MSSIKRRFIQIFVLIFVFTQCFTFSRLPVYAADNIMVIQDKPGNIFVEGETVKIPVQTQGDSVIWTVKDFQGNVVDSGVTAPVVGLATIQPKAGLIGYFDVDIASKKDWEKIGEITTCFAVIRDNSNVKTTDTKFGVMTHFAQGWNNDVMPLITKAGIKLMRDENYWQDIENPTTGKGIYDFSKYQGYMDAAKAEGIELLTPMTWGNYQLYDNYNNRYDTVPYTDEGKQAYANYGTALLDHYNKEYNETGNNKLINALEVWNEYNGTWCQGPATENKPLYYTNMLQKVYETVKTKYPDIPIVGGAAVMIPAGFYEKLFGYGALNYMDILTIHPYRAYGKKNPEGIEWELRKLNERMEYYESEGLGKKVPIWATEFGCIDTDRLYVAQYDIRQAALMLSQGVERMYLYLLRDYSSFAGMGLLRDENAPEGKYTPTIAYAAYSNLIHQLYQAQSLGLETIKDIDGSSDKYSNAYSAKFTKDGKEIRVMWSIEPNGEDIVLKTDEQLTLVDMVGKETALIPVDGKVTIELGETPLYIKGNAAEVQSVIEEAIAASDVTFSDVQGKDGWSYGYYDSTNDTNGYQPADFKPMEWVAYGWNWEWEADKETLPWLKVTAQGAYPTQDSNKYYAIRRWDSTVEGKIRIKGICGRNTTNDYTQMRIFVDGVEVFRKDPINSATIQYATQDIQVHIGSKIDLAVLNPYKETDKEFATFKSSDKGVAITRIYDTTGEPLVENPDPNTKPTIPAPKYVFNPGDLLADSSTQFSGVQGSNGWYYGTYNINTIDAQNPVNLEQFKYDETSQSWKDVLRDSNMYISKDGVHSGDSYMPVRRWVSNAEGTITLSNEMTHASANGDGVTLRVLKNGTRIGQDTTVFNNQITYPLDITVTRGDIIDMVIMKGSNTTEDITAFKAVFTYKATPAPPTSGQVLANAAKDFSYMQGKNGWYYGVYNSGTQYEPKDFLEISYQSSDSTWRYIGKETYMYMSATQVHSGKTYLPVRRWVSNVAGSISISGKLKNATPGDGVDFKVMVDGVQIGDTMHVQGPEVPYNVTALVDAGSTVDLIILKGVNDSYDATQFSAEITYQSQPWDIVYDDFNYTGNAALTGAGWSVPVKTNCSVTQNDGYVTVIDGDTSAVGGYYWMTKSGFTLAAPFTYEVKAKANKAGCSNEFGVRVQNGASYYMPLVLTYDDVTEMGTVQNKVTAPTKTFALDTSVYHTYRAVVHADYSYDLYVDGNFVWSGSAPVITSNGNLFKIGGDSNPTADMDVDAVKIGTGEILTGTSVDSATISPNTGSFDKNPEKQADVSTTITWNDAVQVTDVKNAGVSIGADNYTVSSSALTLTIRKEYLAAQEIGSLALSVQFDKGSAATLTIEISDTTPIEGATLNPDTVIFDKNTGNWANVTTTITLNEAVAFEDIKKDGVSLIPQVYSVSGSALTIKKEYLAAQPIGNLELSLEFARGEAAALSIEIKDTTQAPDTGDVLANSKTDYSFVQGLNGWYYGVYKPAGTGYNPADFIEILYNSADSRWKDTTKEQYLYLSSDGVHPGGTYVPARRWVSNVEGIINLAGTVKNTNSSSDGIDFMILVDGVPVGETTRVQGREYAYNETVTVNVGSKVDFVITKGENLTSDASGFTAQITYQGKPSVPVISAAISPDSASFDKNPANQADVSTTITWNDAAAVTDVKNAGVSIGTEAYSVEAYNVTGSALTIKKEYLAIQATGSLELSIEFDKGNASILFVDIVNTIPPAWPVGSTLSADGTTNTGTMLSWTEAEDDKGVIGYRIYKDGMLVQTVSGTALTFEVSGLSSSTTYTFCVQAGDADGNWTYGPTVTVRTKHSCGNGGGHTPHRR